MRQGSVGNVVSVECKSEDSRECSVGRVGCKSEDSRECGVGSVECKECS